MLNKYKYMKREKRISVKFYVNEKLKPKEINDKTCYPVYAQIVYNTKSSKFKLSIGQLETIYVEKKKGLKDNRFIQLSKDLAYYEEKVKKIISYEVANKPKFSLKGISKKIERYEKPIKSDLYIQLENMMADFFKEVLTYREYIEYEKLTGTTAKIALFKSKVTAEKFSTYSTGKLYLALLEFDRIDKLIGLKERTVYDWVIANKRTGVLANAGELLSNKDRAFVVLFDEFLGRIIA